MRADGGHPVAAHAQPGHGAGIGAAVGFGLSMVAVGASLAVTGKRRHATAATRPPAAGINT